MLGMKIYILVRYFRHPSYNKIYIYYEQVK